MRTLAIAGMTSLLALAPSHAYAAVESPSVPTAATEGLPGLELMADMLAPAAEGAKRGMNKMGGHRMGAMRGHHMRKMGHRGFRSGHHVRMGKIGHRRGYKRPFRGFRLPRTFIRPSYFIGNFGYYGLRQPSYGYGWSRYYDDAVLTDRHGVVHDSVRDLDWDRYNQGYNDGYRDGRATYDDSVLLNDDRVIATPTAAIGSTTYQGDWDGAYREDGSYSGEWSGTYRDAEGRVYEGNYAGTFIGEGEATQVGADYADSAPHWGAPASGSAGDSHDYRGYSQRDEELAYLQRCRKSSGIGGAVVGGALGALAGNRIAGRGNRLGGSLIGGGLGAVAGAAIEQSSDRCRKLLRKYGEEEHHVRRDHHRKQARKHHVYPSGWQGGYYYPAYYYQHAQPMVTTIIIESQPVTTTTTTTTYVDEEVIYTKPRPVAKKRWRKAAPKKTWKPKPVLKGCQQERCLYD
ncbi:regulator RcnB of Ni and Co efflux [Parasphingorhabdus marina DSM 22363]|uniref:Regulator RcnB of Ni and Co efflux n=1 Tax=Parasphingorhabdus marina DSM 22363 TaxID=1123272 RepID=A0A1N6EYD8_9SPHN|nr:RcnB family protein [Parasphingorhabdus marina]SIN87981.1 regulator RcnB of Ni and Co efflux [Parasphingorhabdus marina DSM 22363]